MGAHDGRNAGFATDNGSVGRAAVVVGDDRRRALHDRHPDWSVMAVRKMQSSMNLSMECADFDRQRRSETAASPATTPVI